MTSVVLLPALASVVPPGTVPSAAGAPAPPGASSASTVELDLAGIAAGELGGLPTQAPVHEPGEETDAHAESGEPHAESGDPHAESGDPHAEGSLQDAVLTERLATAPFTVMGLTWDAAEPVDEPADAVVLRYRVREGGRWGEWAVVEASHDGGAEGSAPTRAATDAVVVDDADGLQVWARTTSGTLPGLKVVLVDPGEDPVALPPTSAQAARSPGAPASGTTLAAAAAGPAAPAVVSRAQWGADERLVTCDADFGSAMMAGTVHHTASTNGYGPDDVAGMLRGILAYHTRPESGGGRGWCDIGYNFLVDRFGRIFEGRRGGTDKPVVGVHVSGFNSRSIGVSAIGEYGSVDPSPAMLESISRLLAWKFVLHRIDPAGTVVMISGGGTSLFPEGTPVRFPTVYGHRDAAGTSCPGQRLYDRLPSIRARVVELVGTALDHAPRGALESLLPTADGVAVSGWALDPDTPDPTPVDVYVDGVGTRVTAGLERPDVGAANPGAGSRHGFAATVPAAAGRHVVCVYAIDTGGGTNLVLGCRRVEVVGRSPVGSLDTVTETPDRGVSVTGWAVDPDTRAPIATHVLLDGVPVAAWSADRDRPDVGALFPELGPAHGFAGVIAASQGRHTVCAYGINVGSGANSLLGCRDVTVTNRAPMGALDAVVPFGDRVRVQGWTFDPDTAATIGVHVYVDGRATVARATVARPDIRARFPGQSSNHGFTVEAPAAPGPHTVCAYGIDAGGGQNALLGCRDVVVVNRLPIGSLDGVSVSGSRISASGWAFDPDTARVIAVHVYVDGTGVVWTADRGRADVKAAFPGQSANHGFQGTVTASPGTHTVCAYAINASPGPNALLGCRTVRV